MKRRRGEGGGGGGGRRRLRNWFAFSPRGTILFYLSLSRNALNLALFRGGGRF